MDPPNPVSTKDNLIKRGSAFAPERAASVVSTNVFQFTFAECKNACFLAVVVQSNIALKNILKMQKIRSEPYVFTSGMKENEQFAKNIFKAILL